MYVLILVLKLCMCTYLIPKLFIWYGGLRRAGIVSSSGLSFVMGEGGGGKARSLWDWEGDRQNDLDLHVYSIFACITSFIINLSVFACITSSLLITINNYYCNFQY